MTAEPFQYRAKKWVVQEVSTRIGSSNQHSRLNNENWDVLIILDACRWDILNDIAMWPISDARSPGSSTDEWLSVAESTNIFNGAYIATGNVKYRNRSLGAAEIKPIWKTDWNDRLGTVLPEPVLEQTDKFVLEGKQPAVAHLIPPHAPYVARVGDNWLPTMPEVSGWARDQTEETPDRVSAQVAMSTGKVDLKRAKEAYNASVKSTWNVVRDYIGSWVTDGLDVVLTADHGEAFGDLDEFGMLGHPNRCHIDSLVKVPFEKFSYRLHAEKVETTAEEKLQALGYVE